VVPAVVAGRAIEDGALADGRDPADPEEVAYRWVQADESLVSEAVAAAHEAGARWRDRPLADRRRAVRAVADRLAAARGRLIGVMARDGGKMVAESDPEVSEAIDFARYYAERIPDLEALQVDGARFEPFGTVVVVPPWNFPLAIPAGGVLAALAAGNAVILKPSEITPLTSLLMAEGLRDCGLPENVFQVATGAAVTGSALVDEVDFVMFTGSTRTGKRVMERAAQTLTPVSLELGGKDPMIVLSDADLERAANCAVYYSMQNAGQTCISVERVYVEAPVYDEFVGKVTDKVRKLRQGAPQGPGSVEVGAITFPPQMDTIEAHVKDAVDKGARTLTGGHRRSGAGMFYEPTVLVDVDHTMACMTEETFGPTLPIMKVGDAEEAVRLANDSPYGLAASVFTRDTARGAALASRVQSGAVCVNDAVINYVALELPMGGWKASGLGSRHGANGIRKYTQQQSILVTPKLALRREVHMFPYHRRVTQLLGRALKLLYGRGTRD